MGDKKEKPHLFLKKLIFIVKILFNRRKPRWLCRVEEPIRKSYDDADGTNLIPPARLQMTVTAQKAATGG
ncbi:MAG: hypothetical protein SPK11_08265 [Bullifex sp.]|nr:hypothetical protein [Bullifex sp.]